MTNKPSNSTININYVIDEFNTTLNTSYNNYSGVSYLASTYIPQPIAANSISKLYIIKNEICLKVLSKNENSSGKDCASICAGCPFAHESGTPLVCEISMIESPGAFEAIINSQDIVDLASYSDHNPNRFSDEAIRWLVEQRNGILKEYGYETDLRKMVSLIVKNDKFMKIV